MRLARTKQNLRQKAFALSCICQQDALATPRNVLEISGAKPGAARGRSPTNPDITAKEQTLADVAPVDIGNAAASETARPAYHSTSNSTELGPALVPEGENAQQLPAEVLSASPSASWKMTPANKMGGREPVLRRRPSFKTLAHDPSIPLVYTSEAEEVIANNSAKSLQNTGLVVSESQARSTRGVSHGSDDSAHPKPNSDLNDLLNAALLLKTSSPTSLSDLDSSAFDTALKLQAKTKNSSPPPSNSNSLTPLLIHSDAIFLPSAMEAKTPSAVPSSDGKRTRGSTSSQIAQIMRAVDADRDRLEDRHARMVEALREAERERVEYRDAIARLMQSHREHEGRLLSRIVELQDECDRKSCEVERLREAVAEKGQVEKMLE
jgi:hypothetical protein